MYLEIPLARLQPSKLNPRQHFDDAAMTELTESIRQDGVLTNLIVRPLWCVGTVTAEALGEAKLKREAGIEDDFEIVSGERRYRAALAAKTEHIPVPCRVKVMTDPGVLAINLTEQMQRHDLTPIEEADGFAKMLSFHDETGAAIHTAHTLARRVGKEYSYVLRRLKLLDLPAGLKKAVQAGTVPPSVAELISRVPNKADRDEAGKLAMTGGRDGVMTVAEVRMMLEEKFMMQLKGATFDQENAALVSEAGNCAGCAHRTGNNKEHFGDVKRGDVCTNPACYRSKCAAAFARVATEAASQGVKVLSDGESAKLFETTRPAELRFSCDWVETNTRPMAHLLKNEVKNPPLWRELMERAVKAGMKPEQVLAKDGSGRARWLVNSASLIAAAEKLGEPIFKGQKGCDDVPVTPLAGEDADDTFRRGQREHAQKQKEETQAAAEEAKKLVMVRTASVRAVHRALAKYWVLLPIWSTMLEILMEGSGTPAWRVMAEIVGQKQDSPNRKILNAIDALGQSEQQALVPVLLFAPAIFERGVACEGYKKLAAFAGVNLKQVEKEALELPAKSREAAGGLDKPAPAKKRGPAAKAVAAVKSSIKAKPGKKTR